METYQPFISILELLSIGPRALSELPLATEHKTIKHKNSNRVFLLQKGKSRYFYNNAVFKKYCDHQIQQLIIDCDATATQIDVLLLYSYYKRITLSSTLSFPRIRMQLNSYLLAQGL